MSRLLGLHPTRRRLAGIMLAAFLATLGWGLLAPSSAVAVCAPGVSNGTDPPTPQFPGTGIYSFLEQPPKTLPPDDADPFKPGSAYTVQDVYGYAGLRWNTYDMGCGGDLADPVEAAMNAMANFMMLFPTALVSMTGALLSSAFSPGFLNVFDPMIASVINGMRDSVFLGWLPLAGMALATMLLVKARKNALSETLGAAAGAGAVVFAAALLFQMPLVVGHLADSTVTAVNGTIAGGINGKPAGAAGGADAAAEIEGNLHYSLLYMPWVGGEIGRGNGTTVEKYSADLFKAQAMSWREAQEYDADPGGRGAQIIDDKNTLWDATTQHIKDEDPDAYDHLTGHVSEQRMGYAFLALVGVGFAVPFLLFAGLLVIVALIIVRFAAMVFPGIAPLAMLPQTRHLATGILKTVTAAIINCTVFVMGASLMARAYGYILDPTSGINGLLQIFLMLALTIVMWRVLKPFRKLTAMVGKRNHFAEAAATPADLTRKTGKAVWGLAKTAAAAYFGGTIAGHAAASAMAADGVEREEAAPAPATEEVPQPPTPSTTPQLEAGHAQGPAWKTAGELPQRPSSVGDGYRPPPGPSQPVVPVQDNDGSEVYTIYREGEKPVVWQGPGGNAGDVYDPRAQGATPEAPGGALPAGSTGQAGAPPASGEGGGGQE